jgi:glucosamine--fructose-6-phosphate aminotransferase (isomerizing)
MCGLSGIIQQTNSGLDRSEVVKAWEIMFKETLRRGSDASGMAAIRGGTTFSYKRAGNVKSLLADPQYKKIRDEITDNLSNEVFAILGHSRLVTSGTASLNINNQPIIRDNLILFHNGIVANDLELKSKYGLKSQCDLDSDTIAQLLLIHGVHENPTIALKQLYCEIIGNSTIAIIDNTRQTCLLATNNGSLYTYHNSNSGIFVFSSEPVFLQESLHCLDPHFSSSKVQQLKPNTFLEIPLHGNHKIQPSSFFVNRVDMSSYSPKLARKEESEYIDFSLSEFPNFDDLLRCRKCILPFTFPNLELDREGICRYCRNPLTPETQQFDRGAILEVLGFSNNEPTSQPILVGVSGGRDSCFGLHYLKKDLGLNVIAYTYDWGMVTDLARRNIARICGKLGIEHIIISPDIQSKLRNVRLNLEAWQKKPDLGLIPLFMAGDKQFYFYAHKLSKERRAAAVVLCAGNEYETTDFKVAFSGVVQKTNSGILKDTSTWQSLKLLTYYIKGAIKNPRYINKSLIDSISAFWSSYFLKDSYVYLFKYVKWNERQILSILRDDYGWEDASDTTLTWRIGDGTAAFYNYAYYSVAGFTESDTFRSHQIRAGVMTRDEAMNLVRRENLPRSIALQWYAERIGINLDQLLNSIHSMKKLWM